MRFSSGSATRSCISCAVAPGQAAVTVRILIVKEGSSARPKLKKAKAPARVTVIIRNKVTARSRTASAERLNRFLVLPPGSSQCVSAHPRGGAARQVPRSAHPRGARCVGLRFPHQAGGFEPAEKRPKTTFRRRSRHPFLFRCRRSRQAALRQYG